MEEKVDHTDDILHLPKAGSVVVTATAKIFPQASVKQALTH